MKNTTPGLSSASIRSGSFVLLSTLLIATGCAQNPDIRASRDGTSGITASGNTDYIACVKEDAGQNAPTFIQEENGKTLLFIGSTNPEKASGLVELSSTGSQSQYSVYQRHAWQDKGRLINAAVMCSST
ncbi:hypothetical protein [Pseudomonas sp. LFM046]|uniref:hypothetical protein n=1 Tax=Pseudomonas sp. LFM046 TaxID=1608357 RepID=UPI0005CFD829|nr:hypothetical protein [Pseudomonas sp. LFM046]